MIESRYKILIRNKMLTISTQLVFFDLYILRIDSEKGKSG
jgi:hypothetical protein